MRAVFNIDDVNNLDNMVYSGNDLGVTFDGDEAMFKVWSPTADNICLKLYTKGSDNEDNSAVVGVYPMQFNRVNGVWSVNLKNVKNLYYTYLVSNNGIVNEVVDIYARSTGVNGRRGMVLDLAQTNPYNWADDKPVFNGKPTQAIIWETHVKDFSYSEASGVSRANRGKFLAFTETGTTVNGDKNSPPTCLDYLKWLGVTHIQLSPIFDFATVDEGKVDSDEYNWGYDPLNYNSPEGSYSTNAYDGAVRVKECKQMIAALHSAGIGVVIDVVYNHTYHSDKSYFNMTVPNYYHRINADGTYSNGSGCGCDVASERAMVRKFIVDSVLYWATEYHIDGFRFDLMGLHDVQTINQIRAELDKLPNGENLLMYGEGWDMFTTLSYPNIKMANKRNLGLLNDRVAIFNDNIRDALKGNAFESKSSGFLQNGYCKSNIITGIEGQSNCFCGWAKAPTQTLNYASCHDNFTLYDKLVTSCNKCHGFNTRYDDLVAMNKLSATVLLTSQGIPFIFAGEEFCRTKKGEHNSYNSPASLNMIDWSNLLTFGDVASYYRNLIKIRKMFAPFTDSTTTSANSIRFMNTPDSVIAFTLENLVDKNGWRCICVALNGGCNYENITIEGADSPTEWVIIGDENRVGLDTIGKIYDNNICVAPHSAKILIGYK